MEGKEGKDGRKRWPWLITLFACSGVNEQVMKDQSGNTMPKYGVIDLSTLIPSSSRVTDPLVPQKNVSCPTRQTG
jgi:hypothetical protein